MFGLGGQQIEILLSIAALVLWYRIFYRNGRFSLLSLFVLLSWFAGLLVLFSPRGFV